MTPEEEALFLQELASDIALRVAELDAGEGIMLNGDDELREFFDDVRNEARAELGLPRYERSK